MSLPLATYSFGDVLLTVLEFALLIVWIWVAITVVLDVFRSHDLSNLAKAAWLLLIVIFPLIGVLAYLLIRGHALHEHQAQDRSQLEAFRRFREGGGAGGGGGAADELHKLADLRDRGALTDEEYERAKAKVLK